MCREREREREREGCDLVSSNGIFLETRVGHRSMHGATGFNVFDFNKD